MIGTPIFASINAHDSKGQCSKKDDIEALIYNLVYMYKGTLPWISKINVVENQDFQYLEMMKLKQDIDPEELCMGMPDEFIKIVNYIR